MWRSIRSASVSSPITVRNEWNGASVVPKLMCISRHTLSRKGASGRFPAESSKCGYFSSGQAKLPPSTMTPPTALPCPLRNFVSEWMTTSAPCSTGRNR